MGKLIDLTGKTFTRLTVISEFLKGNKYYAVCQCSCGRLATVRKSHLTTGKIKSCNCLNTELKYQRFKHKESSNGIRSKEYRTWQSIRFRCQDPTQKKFCYWAGRGIKVCDRWMEFDNFLADMGRAPSPKHSIDRINNDGNYEPGNCRWATAKEQSNNRRPRSLKSSHL